jgi:hypothetical protein
VQQLSGVDAGFLYGETAAWHMHAAAVVVLDPADAPVSFSVERLRELIRRRLPQLGLLRYRVVEMPLGIGRPVWVEVPDLDLGAHVKATSLRAPGGMHTAGTGSTLGGLKNSFSAHQKLLRVVWGGSSFFFRSAGEASPSDPVGKRWATSSSPSTASRLGTAIKE